MESQDTALVGEVIKKLEEKYASELTALKDLLAIPNLLPALSNWI